VGFGTEVLFILAVGVLLLGPKPVVELLRCIARAKARLELATRRLKQHLDAELEAPTIRSNHLFRSGRAVMCRRMTGFENRECAASPADVGRSNPPVSYEGEPMHSLVA
jgi:Sec-independent protein translocase protein TatA